MTEIACLCADCAERPVSPSARAHRPQGFQPRFCVGCRARHLRDKNWAHAILYYAAFAAREGELSAERRARDDVAIGGVDASPARPARPRPLRACARDGCGTPSLRDIPFCFADRLLDAEQAGAERQVERELAAAARRLTSRPAHVGYGMAIEAAGGSR